MALFERLSQRHHLPASYTGLTTPHQQDVLRRDICTLAWDDIFFCNTWQVRSTRLYANVAQALIREEEASASPRCKILCVRGHWYLGLLPRTTTGNQHVVKIANCFSILDKSDPYFPNQFVANSDSIFEQCFQAKWGKSYELPYNLPHFVTKISTTLLRYSLGIEDHHKNLSYADKWTVWTL